MEKEVVVKADGVEAVVELVMEVDENDVVV